MPNSNNSIYNEDITMTHKTTNNDTFQFLKDQVDDWQKSALAMCDERDRLRVLVANRDAEISLLNSKIARLERCVVQNALHNSDVASRQEEGNNDNIIFHAGRQVRREIDHERHNDGEGN